MASATVRAAGAAEAAHEVTSCAGALQASLRASYTWIKS